MTIAATNSVIRIKIASPERHRRPAASIDMSPEVYRNGRLNTAMNEPARPLSVDEVAQPLPGPLYDLANPIVAIILRSALRRQRDLSAHGNRDGR